MWFGLRMFISTQLLSLFMLYPDSVTESDLRTWPQGMLTQRQDLSSECLQFWSGYWLHGQPNFPGFLSHMGPEWSLKNLGHQSYRLSIWESRFKSVQDDVSLPFFCHKILQKDSPLTSWNSQHIVCVIWGYFQPQVTENPTQNSLNKKVIYYQNSRSRLAPKWVKSATQQVHQLPMFCYIFLLWHPQASAFPTVVRGLSKS